MLIPLKDYYYLKLEILLNNKTSIVPIPKIYNLTQLNKNVQMFAHKKPNLVHYLETVYLVVHLALPKI